MGRAKLWPFRPDIAPTGLCCRLSPPHSTPRAGGADRLADALDTELLLEQLPGSCLAEHVVLPDLEHLDFIWADDAAERVYTPHVLRHLLQVASAPSRGVQRRAG
jgi:hypothetical protein